MQSPNDAQDVRGETAVDPIDRRPSRLVDYRGLLDLLPYTYATLRKLKCQGRIPYYEAGGKPLFDPEEVLETLTRRHVAAGNVPEGRRSPR